MRRELARIVQVGACYFSAATVAGCTGQIDPVPSGASPRANSPRNDGSRSTTSSAPGDPSNPGDPTSPGGPSNLGDPSNPGDPSDPGDPGTAKPAFDASKCQAPPGRVVRLSKLELQNSIADLLGTKKVVDLPDDARFLNFSSNAQALVTSPFGNALRSTAEALGAEFRAAVKPSQFGSTCTTSDVSARTCATNFIDTYGQKAFRRPIAQDEKDGLLAVYDAGRETGTDGDVQDRFKSGLDYTLRAILQSPEFVYRVELGEANAPASGVTELAPYEVASALSYVLTASPPDDTLLAAAAAGQLASPTALDGQARRLLSAMPERFAAQERRFVREWLAIDFTSPAWDKNTAVYPLYSAALKGALDRETDLFLDDWVGQGPTLTALLTRTDTFVNQVNAPVYGLTASSATMAKVSLDRRQRAGILTMPGFLGTRAHADSSAPVLRGISVVRSVMCGTIPPPPPDVPQLPPITDTSFTTTRDRVEKHVASGACPGCHTRINPLGYPFESYDGLGVYRTKENGYDVDPAGAIVGTAASDRPVANAIELTTLLAESPEVQECFARQTFRYAFGRQEGAADECTVHAAAEAYRGKQLDARELLFALIESKTFVQRKRE
jgi:hypothetical protein